MMQDRGRKLPFIDMARSPASMTDFGTFPPFPTAAANDSFRPVKDITGQPHDTISTSYSYALPAQPAARRTFSSASCESRSSASGGVCLFHATWRRTPEWASRDKSSSMRGLKDALAATDPLTWASSCLARRASTASGDEELLANSDNKLGSARGSRRANTSPGANRFRANRQQTNWSPSRASRRQTF